MVSNMSMKLNDYTILCRQAANWFFSTKNKISGIRSDLMTDTLDTRAL